MKFLKKLFPLALLSLICAQVVNAEIITTLSDNQTSPPTYTYSESDAGTCPYNQICTGNIVLTTMTGFSEWKDTVLLKTKVSVRAAENGEDLTAKDYFQLRSGGPDFYGFYYRVKPGKTYQFDADYTYRFVGKEEEYELSNDFYYKSRSDALNPGGSGAEGMISPIEAKAMGLPPIPKCYRKHPGEFCTNQVVHIFWNNHRGEDKSVLDIDLFIDGKHIKHGNGSEYRGHFQDFYYTLPLLKHSGKPVGFQVKWTVRSYRRPWTSHHENSQTLVGQYNPGLADNCKSDDSWQKCQNNSFDGL